MGRGKLGVIGHGVRTAYFEFDPQATTGIAFCQHDICSGRVTEHPRKIAVHKTDLGQAMPACRTSRFELFLKVAG